MRARARKVEDLPNRRTGAEMGEISGQNMQTIGTSCFLLGSLTFQRPQKHLVPDKETLFFC